MALLSLKRGCKMDLIVVPNKLDLTSYFRYNIKSFIFGLKDFSVNYPEISLEELKKLLKKHPEIKIYIALNKMIFNQDLKVLKEVLLEIDKLNLRGILFYDLSILSLKKSLFLKTDLVWHQTHFVTNYNTCNYFYDQGCKLGILSSEITLEEMLEIKEKTKMEFLVYVVGHSIVSHSRRKLLSNYFTYNQKSNKNDHYRIKDKNKGDQFIIYEDQKGSSICTDQILNGSKPFLELVANGFKYFILDQHFIDDQVFLEILALYQRLIDGTTLDQEQIIAKIDHLIGNYPGFFYQKTIYKVRV